MGIKGYNHPGHKHPVVAIKPDGSIAGYFDFIKDAVEKYGMDRHSITDSCKRGTICRGLKWMYEEDYRKYYMECRTNELAYTLDPNRDRYTYHFCKGHHAGNGLRKRKAEDQQKHKQKFFEMVKRLRQEGKIKPRFKPVLCVNTNQRYNSIKECSQALNIPSCYISYSVHNYRPILGMRFRLIEEMEEGNGK